MMMVVIFTSFYWFIETQNNYIFTVQAQVYKLITIHMEKRYLATEKIYSAEEKKCIF